MSSFNSSSVSPSLLPYLTGEKTDNSSLQGSIVKVNCIFISLLVVISGLRFHVRFHLLRAWYLDDLLTIFAVIFALTQSACSLVAANTGLGAHIWNLSRNPSSLPTSSSLHRILVLLYACYVLYSISIAFAKFSIMASYLRLFPERRLRIIVYGTGIIVLGFWISSVVVILLSIIPMQASWNYIFEDTQGFATMNFIYVAAGFNIATGLLLCFLPTRTLWKLQLPRSQRVVLCILFGMGIFACVASAMRLSQLHNLASPDFSYQVVGSVNWSIIEVGVVILCASIPTLRPLASRWFPSLFSHLSGHVENTTSQHMHQSFAKRTEHYSNIIEAPPSQARLKVEEISLQHIDGSDDLPGACSGKEEANLRTRESSLVSNEWSEGTSIEMTNLSAKAVGTSGSH